MKNITIAASLLLALFFCNSCKTLVPFTDALKIQRNWDDDKMKSFQFYLSHSHGITLRREMVSDTDKVVRGGKIKLIDGKRVEEIWIKAGTPCIFTASEYDSKINGTKMIMQFSPKDSHTLSFGVNQSKETKYVILAEEWRNGIGMMHYADEVFYSTADSKYAFLEVDLRQISKIKITTSKEKGMKLKDSIKSK